MIKGLGELLVALLLVPPEVPLDVERQEGVDVNEENLV